MTNKDMAQQDFDMLKKEFGEIRGDDNSVEMFNTLLKHFKGFNCDGRLFDFNYKRLTATIIMGEKISLNDNVDFYESEDVAPEAFTLEGGCEK